MKPSIESENVLTVTSDAIPLTDAEWKAEARRGVIDEVN